MNGLAALAVVLVVGVETISFARADNGVAPCVNPYAPPPGGWGIPFAAAICNSPERPLMRLNVTGGHVPEWLHGTLYRNVPAQYSFGEDQVRHWFDGMSQIQVFTFDSTGVHMKSRFMNTSTWATLDNATVYGFVGFGTPAHPGPLPYSPTASDTTLDGVPSDLKQRRALLRTEIDALSRRRESMTLDEKQRAVTDLIRRYRLRTDGNPINNDVSILHFHDRFFATTDHSTYIEFDGDSLECLSPNGVRFNDSLHFPGAGGVTHGPVDMHSGEYFNFLTDVVGIFTGEPVQYKFWRFNASALPARGTGKEWGRDVFASFNSTNNTYAHSLGSSEHYVAWLQQPVVMDVLTIMLGFPIIDAMEDISESQPMKLHLVSRDVSKRPHLVATIPWRVGCTFHTGNVFEDPVDGSLVYDVVRFDSCDVYRYFMLDEIFQGMNAKAVGNTGRLMRCRVPTQGPAVKPDGTTTADCADVQPGVAAGFPWFNKQFHQKPYRYAYTTVLFYLNSTSSSSLSHGIVSKVDMHTNLTLGTWIEPNFVLTEAIFFPKDVSDNSGTDPAKEDEGALLTIAFNVVTSLSTLFAIDAKTMTTLFRVDLPFGIPLHFHGIFCKPKMGPGRERFCLWN